MKHEAQRIAIAEACGRCIFQGTGKRERRDSTVSEFCVKCNNPFGYHELPDYLHDLNAMHEAEKVLTDWQRCEYDKVLMEVMSDHARSPHAVDYQVWHATAAQRAEAFLRTIGKWVEDKNETGGK